MEQEPGEKKQLEKEAGSAQTGAGKDTTFSTDFAYRMNELSEKQWKKYNRIFGILAGLLMGSCMFLQPGFYIAESVRLLLAFVIGIFSTNILERKAERSVAVGKKYLAFSFLACMLLYVGYLLIKK